MKKLTQKLMTCLLASALVMCMGGCTSKGIDTDVATNANAVGAGQSNNDSGDKTNEEITLNVWHQWSNDTNELKKCYDEAVETYLKEHPNVHINTQTLDTEAYKTKISAEFAGDASGIDVFYYWGAGTAKKLVEADKLLALDEYITPEVEAKILPGSTSAFTYDGKTYSLPSFSWYSTFFCNKDLFEQAGTEIPTTYEELVEACKKLNAIGVTPIASGAKDGWNAAMIYQAIAEREVGAEDVNKMLSGEIPFSEDGYKEAAEKVVELYNIGAFGKNPLESGNDDANSAFITGKAAMRIMGSWFANQVYTDVSATINPEDVVACQFPMIEGKGSETDYCGGFVESFWVNSHTAYPKEAAEFTIFMSEQMGKAAYETGSGFCGWDVEVDESNLNPLFIQIKELLNEDTAGVLAWDTSLESNPATIHNEQTQTLFAPEADLEAFIQEHEDVINE